MSKTQTKEPKRRMKRKQYEKALLKLQTELRPMDVQSYARWYDYSQAREAERPAVCTGEILKRSWKWKV